MRRRTATLSWTMVAVTAATLVAACGPPGGGGAPVDHETAQKNLESNTNAIAHRFSGSLAFMEETKFASNGYFGSPCPPSRTTPQPEDGSSESTCDESGSPIEAQTRRVTRELLSELNEHVVHEENIETETESSVTYLVDGEDVCGEPARAVCSDGSSSEECTAGQSDYYKQCVREADKMEYRVRVTSPTEGALDVDLLVGPGRHKPLEFELRKRRVAAIADLGGIKKSIEHADTVYDSDVGSQLPSTMKGRIRAQLESKRSKHIHFEVKLETAINISGGDYGAALAQAAKPVFGATADGEAETLTTTVNFNEISGNFPVSYYEYEEQPRSGSGSSGSSQPEETVLDYAFRLAGLSAQAKYTAGSSEVEVSDVGLGNSTSWLKIDGKKSVTVDLNPNHGRAFDATVGWEWADDGSYVDALTFEAAPAVGLRTALAFAHVKETLYVEPWLEDYEFEGTFAGASPVKARLTGEYFEVVDGQGDLRSTSPSSHKTAGAGDCIATVYDDESSSGEYHPLQDVTVFDDCMAE